MQKSREEIEQSRITRKLLQLKYQEEILPLMVAEIDKRIEESSLSRIYQHLQSSDPFCVVSAYRYNYTKQKNKIRHKKLESAVHKAGYGYIPMLAFFKEDTPPYKESKEESLFIPDCTENVGLKLGKEFD